MIIDNVPYLCGGTFFVLILQARKAKSTARKKINSGSDGLADTDIMAGLLDIADPERMEPYMDSFRKNVSEYKACKYNGGIHITFTNKDVISGFDSVVRNEYNTALSRTKAFTSRMLGSEQQRKWLVTALLDLIDQDSSIDDTQLFYIQSNGLPLKKADLRLLSDFEFEPFILGVLHFIVANRPKNKLGRDTIEHWHKPINRAEWEFISDIGKGIAHNINVHFLVPISDIVVPTGKETTTTSTPVFIPVGMVYYDTNDGKLHFGSESVEVLPEMLPPEMIQPKEEKYIQALLDAYADDSGNPRYTQDDISGLASKYKRNLKEQRYNFYGAIRVCKIAENRLINGKSEIRKWKRGTYDYISDTYNDDYDSGYRRLIEVMKKVVDTPHVSDIDNFQNLIEPKVKKGICHLLVDDGEMQWVFPDE
jgi:hypothetical protein